MGGREKELRRKAKKPPPVPIKTYKWEEVRRAKRRGKYPYTYLYKGPYVEFIMEEEQKLIPAEEKKRKVRKLKKMGNVDEPSVKKQQGGKKLEEADGKGAIDAGKQTVEENKKKEEQIKVIEGQQKAIEETPKQVEESLKTAEEIKKIPQDSKLDVAMEVDISSDKLTEHLERMNIEEMKLEEETDQFAYKLLEEESPTEETKDTLTITTETRDLSIERQMDEGKDVEMITADSGKLLSSKEEQQIDSSKYDSKTIESDISFTSSNVEQLLEKDDISKSISEATSSGIETKKDATQLEVPLDKKRKHSPESELTKSNLSLFEKMKKAKFKPPTFKIPKFKKLTFSKRFSKRVKTEPVVVAKVEAPVAKKKSESPVYIHIPLKPTAEELESERQQEIMRSRFQSRQKQEAAAEKREQSSSAKNGATQKSTPTIETKSKVETSPGKNDSIKVVASKWKGFQSKSPKKSSPAKKSSLKSTNGKKGSPKSEKKDSPAKRKLSLETKKDDDAPIEYIHIPLHLTPEELEQEAQRKRAKPEEVIKKVEKLKSSPTTPKTSSKSKESKKPKESPKGAIKKTTKSTSFKDSTVKISKDIKKLASKLKNVHKRNKKASPKKTSLKKPEPISTNGKKSSPTRKHQDSPAEYIYIPLKGPLIREVIKVEQIEIDDSQTETEMQTTKHATFKDLEESIDVQETANVIKPKEVKDSQKDLQQEVVEEKQEVVSVEPAVKDKTAEDIQEKVESKADGVEEKASKKKIKPDIAPKPKLEKLGKKESNEEVLKPKEIPTQKESEKIDTQEATKPTEQENKQEEIKQIIDEKPKIVSKDAEVEIKADKIKAIDTTKDNKQESDVQIQKESEQPLQSDTSKTTETETPAETESKTMMSKIKGIPQKQLKRADSKIVDGTEKVSEVAPTKPKQNKNEQIKKFEMAAEIEKEQVQSKETIALEEKPKAEVKPLQQKDEPKEEEAKSLMSKLRSFSFKKTQSIDVKDEVPPIKKEAIPGEVAPEVKHEHKLGERLQQIRDVEVARLTSSSPNLQTESEKSKESPKESEPHSLMSKLKGFKQKISMSIDQLDLPEVLKPLTLTKTLTESPEDKPVVTDADIEAMAAKLFDDRKGESKDETQTKKFIHKLKRGFTITKQRQPDLKEEVEPMEVDIFAARIPTPPVHATRKEDIVNLDTAEEAPLQMEASKTVKASEESTKEEPIKDETPKEGTVKQETDNMVRADEGKKVELKAAATEKSEQAIKDVGEKSKQIVEKKSNEKIVEIVQKADETQPHETPTDKLLTDVDKPPELATMQEKPQKQPQKGDSKQEKSEEPEPKPETFMSKLKGFKKPEKKTPPAKKKSVKPFNGKKVSPTSPKKVTNGKKSSKSSQEGDSPQVESVKASESEEIVFQKGKDDERTDTEIKSNEEHLSSQEVAKQEENIKSEQEASHAPKIIGETLKKEPEKLIKSETTKDSIMSKLKGMKHKADKKSPPSKTKKVGKSSPKAEKKDVEEKKPDDAPTKYIFIPLRSSETESANKQQERKTDGSGGGEVKEEVITSTVKETQAVKVTEKIPGNDKSIKEVSETKEAAIKEETIKEDSTLTKAEAKPAETSTKDVIKSKLKGFMPKADKKSPTSKTKLTKQPTVDKEISQEEKKIDESPTKYIHIPLKPTEAGLQEETKKLGEEEHKESVEIITASKDKTEAREPEKVATVVEPKTGEVKSEPKELTKAEEKPDKDKLMQTTAIKESVKSTWKGIKQKAKSPPFKKKMKKTSPKSEKKPTTTKKTSPPVAKPRGDSPVEYIIIPLNPTAEQLAGEREQEAKRKHEEREKQNLLETSKLATKEPSPKPKAKKESETKSTAKGAIRKQAEEQGKKIKESTSKLTEDIKKFAAKLKEMQKKQKKPTFKTFKRGSKVGSGKKLSPTQVRNPSEVKISPTKTAEQSDSPVKYIHIPLKPTEEEIKQMKLNAELLAKEAQEFKFKSKPSSTKELEDKLEKVEISSEKAPETVTKVEPKPEEVKKEISQTALDTLKKTKDYGMSKLKAFKEAVQPMIDKAQEKKIEKIDDKTKDITEMKKDTMFISLKVEESPKQEVVLHETETQKIVENPAEQLAEKPKETPEEILSKEPPPVPVKKRRKRTSVKEKVSSTDSSHHYEPISKEDEEDGLKRAITTPKEDTEKAGKEVILLKATNGSDVTEDNIIYETIEIKGESFKGNQIFQNLKDAVDGEELEGSPIKEEKKKWSETIDHEYEPINPPGESQSKPTEAPVPSVHTQPQPAEPTKGIKVAEPLVERRLLRIPLDQDLIVPSSNQDLTSIDRSQGDTTSKTTSLDTRSKTDDKLLTTPELSSRTETINTSQVDSAQLETLPLQKESRTREAMARQEPQRHNIQEKLKTQAGKLKTKLKGIKKPTFTITNAKFSPKFRRPKFQKPKFERPKFQKPNFQRPKFDTSKFTMPKMPDMSNITFPSFNLARGAKRPPPTEERNVTTESADSRRNIFDFRTYPRLFETKKHRDNITTTTTSDEATVPPEFATVPRAAARKKGPVGARWVHRFSDIKYVDDESKVTPTYRDELSSRDRGDSLERRMEADFRYKQALEEDDMRDYERENQDINLRSYNPDVPERWKHGSFKDKEAPLGDMEDIDLRDEPETDEPSKHSNIDEHSSIASSGHRAGVLEEIDSDQFFLREKGISQDNIQVGLYLSSEIRDAFRQPVNALSQMEGVQPGYGSRDYELDASDLSLSRPSRPKRKHLKKTKRIKKTPHASEERIAYDQESVNTEPEEFTMEFADYKTFPPARPRRGKKPKSHPKVLDVTEIDIPIDDELNIENVPIRSEEDLQEVPNILGYVEKDLNVNDEYDKYLNDDRLMYENEVMEGIEQPEIVISPDQKYEIAQNDIDKFLLETGMIDTPKPPTRRQKSLRSLTASEHDSIIGEFNRDKLIHDMPEQEINVFRVEHEYIIPVDEQPIVPVRRIRSRSRSSQADDDRTSRGVESIETEECHEPSCVEDLRDSMGYAVIDKSKREPPLPSAPKRRRSTKSNKSTRSSETKFFTVPRPLNDAPVPTRPTRNYSTLGPNRPPRKKPDQDVQSDDEEKENIDISQYIEIEDEDHSRDLQSGEVISKMKSRPLPAPPRPPRKTRDHSKEALRDITQETNIITETEDEKLTGISTASPQMEAVEEITVSTQTDPLPDDFCCEEVVQEPTDRIVAPSRRKRSIQRDSSMEFKTMERPKTPLERSASPHAMVIEKRVQTPIEDETLTHASLVVRPVAEYPPDSYVSKRFGADIPDILNQNIIPVQSESIQEYKIQDDEFKDSLSMEKDELDAEITLQPLDEIKEQITQKQEPESTPEKIERVKKVQEPTKIVETEPEVLQSKSEEPGEPPAIPEKPHRRKSQAQSPPVQPQIIEHQVPVSVTPGPDTEVEVLKAHRLQVTDLDVERLNVTELQAQKILVSEIDGVSLQISELTSKSGNLIVNGLELPSGLIQEILDRLQPPQPSTTQSSEQVGTQTIVESDNTNIKPTTQTEQVSTQTSLEGTEEATQTLEQQPDIEQVATQTSLDEPDNNKELGFTELLRTEQVATQTSLVDPMEDTKTPAEDIKTQMEESITPIEDSGTPADSKTPQDSKTLVEDIAAPVEDSKTLIEVIKTTAEDNKSSFEYITTSKVPLENINLEEAEIKVLEVHIDDTEILEDDSSIPQGFTQLTSEPIKLATSEENLMDAEDEQLEDIKQRIRSIESEMTDMTTGITDIKSEIEKIIETATEHILREKEDKDDIIQMEEEELDKLEETPMSLKEQIMKTLLGEPATSELLGKADILDERPKEIVEEGFIQIEQDGSDEDLPNLEERTSYLEEEIIEELIGQSLMQPISESASRQAAEEEDITDEFFAHDELQPISKTTSKQEEKEEMIQDILAEELLLQRIFETKFSGQEDTDEVLLEDHQEKLFQPISESALKLEEINDELLPRELLQPISETASRPEEEKEQIIEELVEQDLPQPIPGSTSKQDEEMIRKLLAQGLLVKRTSKSKYRRQESKDEFLLEDFEQEEEEGDDEIFVQELLQPISEQMVKTAITQSEIPSSKDSSKEAITSKQEEEEMIRELLAQGLLLKRTSESKYRRQESKEIFLLEDFEQEEEKDESLQPISEQMVKTAVTQPEIPISKDSSKEAITSKQEEEMIQELLAQGLLLKRTSESKYRRQESKEIFLLEDFEQEEEEDESLQPISEQMVKTAVTQPEIPISKDSSKESITTKQSKEVDDSKETHQVRKPAKPKTHDTFAEHLTESSQSTHSHPPDRPPLPPRLPEQYQEQFQEQEYILHEVPHSYYPEYVHSLPSQSFYTLRPEEEIPVHHRRRRHHRRYSRSSSEDEERRTTSRRRTTRSPEPSIPQLSCQLVKACSNTTGRYMRQLVNSVSTQLLSTEEDKRNFKIAVIILLVLIAGLILLGYGNSGKTIHLHHWEYFNPPNNF